MSDMRHVLDTPAGPVELVCRVDDLEPSLHSVQRFGAGVRETWVSPGRLEVVFLRTELGPPRHREDRPPLDGYVGIVWTLSAAVECGPLTFSAHLTDPAVRESSAPNNGEHLSAVTYETDDFALSIGTQDDEALRSRTADRPGPWGQLRLPPEWSHPLADPWNGEHGAREHGTGVTVRLPPLPAGRQADVHVAIAWAYRSDPDDTSTWFAVDTDPGWILSAASEVRAGPAPPQHGAAGEPPHSRRAGEPDVL